MKDIKTYALTAAKAFLKRRGYELLSTEWTSPAGDSSIDIVARDGDTLAFVEVAAREGAEEGFPKEYHTEDIRSDRERAAADWLALEGPDLPGDYSLRFDIVSIMSLGASRAFVRHHVNALG